MSDLYRRLRSKDQSRAEGHAKRSGYKAGGAITPAKAVGEHEDHLHKGQPKTRIKRKRGGSVPGGAAAMRLDKKPRGSKLNGGEAVYTKPNRSAVEKPKLTTTNVDTINLPKRASGGKISPALTGPQGHNGMGKLANLGKFAHKAKGGAVQKREGGGSIDTDGSVATPMREDIALVPPTPKPGGSGLGRIVERGRMRGLDRMMGSEGGSDSVSSMLGKSAPTTRPGSDVPVMAKRGGKIAKHAAGGRVKKPTVNVIVNTQPAKPEGPDIGKMLAAAAASKPPMPPQLPPGGPIPGAPPGGPGMPPPGMGAPPVMRKTGGRIPEAKMGPKTIPVHEKITVKSYQRRKGGKVC